MKITENFDFKEVGSQEKAVLEHIKYFGSITSMEAFDLLGITRLSAKIYSLRHHGEPIITVPIKRKNRYGNIVLYGGYRFVQNDEELKELQEHYPDINFKKIEEC